MPLVEHSPLEFVMFRASVIIVTESFPLHWAGRVSSKDAPVFLFILFNDTDLDPIGESIVLHIPDKASTSSF